MTEEKKPRRQKPAEKEPTTKAEFTVKAGKVQAKLNAIASNHKKATGTATKRIDAKYKKLIGEELDGLQADVVNLLVLPEFAVDDVLSDLVSEDFVEITDDVNEAAAE
jgi:predicted transcriptional regulator